MRISIILAFISVVIVLCIVVYQDSQQRMESDEQFLNEKTLVIADDDARMRRVQIEKNIGGNKKIKCIFYKFFMKSRCLNLPVFGLVKN